MRLSDATSELVELSRRSPANGGAKADKIKRNGGGNLWRDKDYSIKEEKVIGGPSVPDEIPPVKVIKNDRGEPIGILTTAGDWDIKNRT